MRQDVTVGCDGQNNREVCAARTPAGCQVGYSEVQSDREAGAAH